MVNTVERVAKLLEGGHPIIVYSEEDASLLVELFNSKYKRKLRVGKFVATNEGNKWFVDYFKDS